MMNSYFSKYGLEKNIMSNYTWGQKNLYFTDINMWVIVNTSNKNDIYLKWKCCTCNVIQKIIIKCTDNKQEYFNLLIWVPCSESSIMASYLYWIQVHKPKY